MMITGTSHTPATPAIPEGVDFSYTPDVQRFVNNLTDTVYDGLEEFHPQTPPEWVEYITAIERRLMSELQQERLYWSGKPHRRR